MSKVRRPAGGCHYCPGNTTPLTTDHIVPRSRGGTNHPWNLIAACYRCNQNKADMLPDCPCAYCQNAIEQHWQWLMERPYGERGPLVRLVEGMYQDRWTGGWFDSEGVSDAVPRGAPHGGPSRRRGDSRRIGRSGAGRSNA